MTARAQSFFRERLTRWLPARVALARLAGPGGLPDVAGELKTIAESLSKTTHRTDPNFVQLASDLKALFSGASELGKTTGKHVGTVRESLQHCRLTGPGGLSELSFSKLESGISEAAQNLTALSGVGSSLARLQTQGRQMERIAMFLKASVCGFAVESARSASCQQAFGAFVDELRQLAEKIGGLGDAIHDQSIQVCADLERVNRSTSADLEKLRQLARQSEATVRQTSSQMQQLLDSAWSALQQAEIHAREITRHASDAVYHLQFGDILRQKLEHVVSGLSDAAQKLENNSAAERSQAPHILAIQMGQLEMIESEIKAAQSQLLNAFNGLGSETNHVLNNVRTIGSGSKTSERKQNVFEDLKTDLIALNSLQSQGHQICQKTRESSLQAMDASAQLTRHLDHVREINREMHLQALNAIIKTSLLGDEGQTLGVLSMHVHTIFEESTVLVNETVDVLHSVTAQTGQTGSRETAITGESGVDLQSGLEQLSRVHEGFENAVASAVSIGEQQDTRLKEARQRLEFFSELSAQIAAIRHEIDQVYQCLPKTVPSADVPGESLAGRYTMESEREVHRRLSGQAAPAAAVTTLVAAGAATAAAAPPEDNMELFDMPSPEQAQQGAAAPATVSASKDENLGDNIELF